MQPYISPEEKLGLPAYGDHQVSLAAEPIRDRIRAPFAASGQYTPREGHKNISAREVFEAAGFNIVRPSGIPADLRPLIIQAVRDTGGSEAYGLPLRFKKVLTQEAEPAGQTNDWPGEFEIAANDDFSTLYFFHDLGVKNPFGKVSWSSFRRRGDRYAFQTHNHDSYTGDVVETVAHHLAIDEVAKTRTAVQGGLEAPEA